MLGLCLAALVLGWIGYLLVGLLVGAGDEVKVPNVIGQESGEALEIILTAGLRPRLPLEENYHDDIQAGHIMEQSPLPGSLVKKGRELHLVKSLGSKKVAAPRLTGLDLQSAEWELRRLGLRMGVIMSVNHDQVEDGLIIAQEPVAKDHIQRGSLVDVLISEGPASRLLILPEIHGRNVLQARQIMEQAGFKNVKEQPVTDSELPPGTVVWQHPAAGVPVQDDQEVFLAVSRPETGQGEVRYRYFSYPMPLTVRPGEVTVYMQDDFGFRQVLKKNYWRDHRLEFIERTAGDAAVIVYYKGQRVVEDFISGDE
jgi:serine/threonine-protein kinase